MTLQSSAHTNQAFRKSSSTYIYSSKRKVSYNSSNVLIQFPKKETHLHPLAVAQTNSRPPGCTAIAPGVSAASSPTTTLACETTSNRARISSARDQSQTCPPSHPHPTGHRGSSRHSPGARRRGRRPWRRTRGGRRAAGTMPWRRARTPRGGG